GACEERAEAGGRSHGRSHYHSLRRIRGGPMRTRAFGCLAAGVIAAALFSPAASRAEEPVGVHPSPLFVEHCAKCHGADGKAETPEGRERHAEVFNDPKWQESKRKKADKL